MKTITFYNVKGGAGKTTSLALFSLALAELGKTVAILDKDNLQVASRFVDSIDHQNIKHMEANTKADICLIDTGGGIDPKEVKGYEDASDFMVIPMGLNSLDIGATAEAIQNLTKPKKARLLLNKVSTRTQAFKQKNNVLTALKIPALKSFLSLKVSYQYAIGEGWNALDKRAKDEVLNIVNELNIVK
jgi:cellulose biosynthesis protein BcsQ